MASLLLFFVYSFMYNKGMIAPWQMFICLVVFVKNRSKRPLKSSIVVILRSCVDVVVDDVGIGVTVAVANRADDVTVTSGNPDFVSAVSTKAAPREVTTGILTGETK